MPKVIRNINDPQNAITVDGIPVHREGRIYLTSYHQWFPVLNTSMHFCYKDPTVVRGSTILCTCGAAAGVFGREAYRKLTSVNYGNEVISCTHYIQYRSHADGSHE